MHRTIVLIPIVVLTLLAACTAAPAHHSRSIDAGAQQAARPTGFGAAVDRDIARVRRATASYHTVDSAVAAGYPGRVGNCVEHPEHGGMGFHHQNPALLDDKIEIERPEILVYERGQRGEYKLNGVEYIVPISAWTSDKPPTVMGQNLKRAPALGIWYLPVWIWEENPSGLFADWNPKVQCRQT